MALFLSASQSQDDLHTIWNSAVIKQDLQQICMKIKFYFHQGENKHMGGCLILFIKDHLYN